MNGPERRLACTHFFRFFRRPAGAFVGTARNSSQKCHHPTTQRNGNRSQGRCNHISPGLNNASSEKLFGCCITNPLGDAAPEQLFERCNFLPWRNVVTAPADASLGWFSPAAVLSVLMVLLRPSAPHNLSMSPYRRRRRTSPSPILSSFVDDCLDFLLTSSYCY